MFWTHFRELIATDEPLKRAFYAEMCRAERWSTRTLQDQVKRMLYERTAVSKKPDEVIRAEIAGLRDEDRVTPDLVFRDPHFLDFLGLPERYRERDLEQPILRELEAFLLELGTDFTFVARQKRISADYEDYCLDLLFYHRRLRRLVAIDLKLGRFQAADKGQMELYLRWLQEHETHPDEEPPIGLILCAGKSAEHVRLLRLEAGWALRLSQNEEVRWVNEGKPPTSKEIDSGVPVLHSAAKGYLLCPSCGNTLTPPPDDAAGAGGRRNTRGRSGRRDESGHSEICPRRGGRPEPLAITTYGRVEVLRLLAPLPLSDEPHQWESWGLSFGYALLNGMQHFFMLDASELDFELEGPWRTGDAACRYGMLSLAFIDPSLGGSGYLSRIAEQFHGVAKRAIEHLDHPDCETACYRRLKTYYNQRFHEQLAWPQTLPGLNELASAPPKPRPQDTGDLEEPRPWLEAYTAGVGSPLELMFLRLFEKHDFHPEKQLPVAPTPGELPISVADFAVPDRRLAIYIDGAAFHSGQRLRRDRFIRDRLRGGDPPWRVEELRAADLRHGEALVARLKRGDTW